MNGIERLLAVVGQLRDPDGGCPWDLKQTHQSLAPYMLEEAYEAVEVIGEASGAQNSTDDGVGTTESLQTPMERLKEELGDVLLQITLHAQLAKDAGHFEFSDVCNGIADKLIRRHPHVFSDTSVANAEEVTANWEQIKQAEKGAQKPQSVLDGVSKASPALTRALETSKKAVKVGFEWPSFDSLWACVMSEYDEFRSEVDGERRFHELQNELGDILFATVNLSRHFKIDPETALTLATAKFTRRFNAMEKLAEKPLEELSFEEWDALWNRAKETVST